MQSSSNDGAFGPAARRVISVALALRPFLFALLALVAALPWLRTAASMNLFRDGQFLSAYEHVATETVRRFGELPRWDPYTCGGLYSLGNPQTRFASPTFLISLLFGARRAEPVIAFVLLFVGMEGAYRLIRTWSGSGVVALVVAPIAALNGFFGASYYHGWMQFFGFELVPWLFYGLALVARARTSGIVVVAVAASILVGMGSTYAIPLSALFAAPVFLANVVPRRPLRRRRAFVLLAAASLFTAGLCAVRVLPILETMRLAPRIMAGAPAHSAGTLFGFLFEPSVATAGNLDLRGEFFVSAWAIPLFLVAFAGGRRALAPLLVAAFAALAAAGYALPVFAWVRAIPGFAILRYPERLLYFATLFGLVAGAIGLAALLRAPKLPVLARRASALGAFALTALATAAQISDFHGIADGRVLTPPPVELARPFQQARGNRWIASYYAPLSRGSISCGEAYPVPMSTRLRGNLDADEYLEDPHAGTVSRVHWSPNRIVLAATLSQPTRVLVNQNHHTGWRSNVGRVVSVDGLLAVELPRGTHRVILRFLPRSGVAGAMASLLAAFLLVYCTRRRADDRAWLVASIAPLAVALLACLAIAEPRTTYAATNADGSPARVDAIPAGATRIDARFDVPVTLVAAELPRARDAAGNVPVALYWRVDGPVPREVGTFLHVEREGRLVAQADREVVAASYFFADAPRGVIVRDVIYVTLPPGSSNLRFLGGLWRPSGDGARISATSGPHVPDGRVDLGTVAMP